MADLLKSIGNFFRGKKDEAAKKLADPIRDGKFAIEDSKKQIADFQRKIAVLMAQTNKLEKQKATAQAEETKYQNMAVKAAQAGNEDDARKLLEEKNRHSKTVTSCTSQIEKNTSITTNLRNQLDKARTKIADAENNHASLAARKEAADIRKDMAKASSEFNADGNALAALDDLEQQVAEDEAEAEAWEDLSATENAATDLADKYSGGSADVDAELAALMAGNKKTEPASA
jgi:phage shock protein A